MNELASVPERAKAIIDYWFQDLTDDSRLDPSAEPFKTCYARWYGKEPSTDAEIRRFFEGDLDAVARAPDWNETVRAWSAAPDGLLALTILLDQLPRNMHRGTARMYEHDVLALLVATRALGLPSYEDASLVRRMFLVVPFMHAESSVLQRFTVEEFRSLAKLAETRSPHNVAFFRMALGYAQRHLDVVEAYGRFPHRNAILGRTSTAAEQTYLAGDNPGF
jgi:uncharacterized protein (DUF924 family)